MEELILVILTFVGEILLESLIYFPWDIFMVSREKKKDGELNAFGWLLISLFAGMAVGGISVWILSSAMLLFSWLRVANLLIAPLLAGGFALRMSKRRNQKEIDSNNKLHYFIAFVFTAGVIGVRFVLTTKT